jgi:hypothetical protein
VVDARVRGDQHDRIGLADSVVQWHALQPKGRREET